MNQFGTDVMAVVVIVGGVAVGGASTLLFSDTSEDVAYECSTTVRSQPRVVVAMGSGESTFVVAPNVDFRTSDECVVSVHFDDLQRERIERLAEQARARAERAGERVERARERGERARERAERALERDLDRADEFQLQFDDGDFDFDFNFDFEGMELQLDDLDLQLSGLDGDIGIAVERRVEEEMKRLEERLSRLNREIGR